MRRYPFESKEHFESRKGPVNLLAATTTVLALAGVVAFKEIVVDPILRSDDSTLLLPAEKTAAPRPTPIMDILHPDPTEAPR